MPRVRGGGDPQGQDYACAAREAARRLGGNAHDEPSCGFHFGGAL
jgi:hypothetical protein